MKALLGYVMTGWLWGVLSAWFNREAQSQLSLWRRVAYVVMWVVVWPVCLIVMFWMAATSSRE